MKILLGACLLGTALLDQMPNMRECPLPVEPVDKADFLLPLKREVGRDFYQYQEDD